MSNSSEKRVVYLVVTSWDNDGDHEESPEVRPFSNLRAAQEYMRCTRAADKDHGVTQSLDDPDETWVVTDEPEHFKAWNENKNAWIDIQIIEQEVLNKCPIEWQELAETVPDATAFPAERMEFSKSHYAFEICTCNKHMPVYVIYRSGLYGSREDALAAFVNPETREVFAALDGFQEMSHYGGMVPFEFEGTYEEIEDYSAAYFDGVQEVKSAVDALITWAKSEDHFPNPNYGCEHRIMEFVSHA